VQGTENLARAAARAGVSRFVFVSTAKVNGEATWGRPFSERDTPNPQDPYALSKWEAEQALAKVSAETGLAVTVLRPPLVYGPGVKGNFLSLLKWVERGVPLPVALIDNRRSLLYVGNLADAIVRCLNVPQADGRTYLLCDGEDVSTPELIRRLSLQFGRRPRLFPIPASMLEFGCKLLGRGSAYDRLAGSLQLDSSAITSELGWQPLFTLDAGLRDTVDWFKHRRLLKPISNIPPAEAEEQYDAMLDEPVMAA
jgi:nucleoside-diphosphate-sugar epimerase